MLSEWANNVEFPTSVETDDDGNVVETVEHPNDGDWLETSTTRDGNDPKIAPLSIDYDYVGMLNNILARRALILQKCHVPQRADSENSTGIATSAASGWDDAEVSAARQQLIMESCKMREVRVVLQAIRASSDVPVGSKLRKLKAMDVMPSIKRQKNYELVSKMNFFASGISHGLHPKPLIKEMNAFAILNRFIWIPSRIWRSTSRQRLRRMNAQMRILTTVTDGTGTTSTRQETAA